MRRKTCVRWALLVGLAGGLAAPSAGRARGLLDESVVSKAPPASRLAVVLATDCGVEMDDQWALAHILLSQELALRAVITTHASSIGFSSAASAKTAAEVIARVPPAAGSPPPPVVPGSDSPLQEVTTPRESPGVDMLLELSRSHSASRRLVVLATGAGTDVASAILKDPSVVSRVTVVAMGFDDWPGGGDGFNVKNDPLAWRIILDSDVPVVVASGAAARRGLRLTRAEGAALMRSHGGVGGYLYSVFDDWLTRQATLVARFVAPETWVVWDESVVAYALGMARGDEVPRPQLQSDLSFSHPETNRRLTWVTEIDSVRLWRDFTRKIDARRP